MPVRPSPRSPAPRRLVARPVARVLVALLAVLVPALVAPTLAPAPASAASGDLVYVAQASAAGNTTTQSVRVPTEVVAGDRLLLVLTANATVAPTAPTGWDLVESVDGSGTTGRAWSRVATATDPGTAVRVTTPTAVKWTLSVAGYRTEGGASPSVSAAEGAAGDASASSHVAPAVAVASARSWVVSVWSEKSSTTATWTLPAGVTRRGDAAATGSGRVSTVLADSAAAVATGTAPARTATTSVAVNRSVTFSIVVTPAAVAANRAPTASFTSSCSGLTCTFDAGASADPDGDPLTYAWTFGDGQSGTGVAPTRTYAAAGSRTVTLTVSDGTATAQTTRTVNPTATSTSALSHVATAATAGNSASASAVVPAGVQAGDRLLLFLTTNTTTTPATPTGWDLVESVDGSGTSGRAWSRVATATDAGSTVRVTTPVTVKWSLGVQAYRASTGTPALAASDVAAGNTSASTHATPAVPVATSGSWLVSVWSEKSSGTATWTLPAGATSRGSAAATGSGRVSMVLADSGAPVATGTASARTATTSAAVNRSVTWSVVLAPAAAANRAPDAAFTSTCAALVCGFDASGSSDPDGNALTYTWAFGDGQSGTGVSPSHTYATAGSRTVTLTVSDGTAQDTATGVVAPVAPTGPGHTSLVPSVPRTDTPKISNGEIWDIEVVGTTAYVAGTFTSLTDTSGARTTYAQAGLAAFDLDTGLVVSSFRPTFGGGGVDAVEASPDGTRLYASGTFNTVNGVTKRKVASLNPATGAPLAGFQANGNNQVNALAVGAGTVYLGGRFTSVNGTPMTGLAAVDATTGALDTAFDNQISGGTGPDGALTVQKLLLTPDERTLVVVHTGRRIDGQDRYGIGLVDTTTKELLPWRTRLWEDNLQFVGGINRLTSGALSPDGTWFAVGSGSGGDRPPINDTVVAFRVAGGADQQPTWISRGFDSIYSIAISERAVYIGGHFSFNESPTAPDPWPGLETVGYGLGQGIGAYQLGDAIVRRDHLGALNPADGKALEWNPGSNSFEGNKAMEVTSRGLLTGGDATTQGGYNVGRVAFFDNEDLPVATATDTVIADPIEGRVWPAGEPHVISGTATSGSTLSRVQVELRDASGRYLQDDLTTWGAANTINATLGTPTGGRTPWSLAVTIPDTRVLTVLAKAFSSDGTSDPTKASKKFETFSFTDSEPTTRLTSPTTSLITSTTVLVKGTATDDVGVVAVNLFFRDSSNRHLLADGTLSDGYATIRVEPDVVGATSATWQYEVTLPHEGEWRIGFAAVDTAGQVDTGVFARDFTVDSSGQAPKVTLTSPVAVTPPTVAPPLTRTAGGTLTFAGTATDDLDLASVEIQLRNTTTRQNLASDGTWGTDVTAGWYRISPVNLSGATYQWSWTTPFTLVNGTYTFAVRSTDDQDLTTASGDQGRLTINVGVVGDTAPDTALAFTGTDMSPVALSLPLSGSATDDRGVGAVRVALLESDTGRYVQPGGTLGTSYATLDAVLATPGATSTTWSLTVMLPLAGTYNVTAVAVDSANQLDTSTTGATAKYLVYPGDLDPSLNTTLQVPTTGSAYTESRVVVSGRAEDDVAMGRVEVLVVNGAGQFMSSTGTFSTTERWISAFLNSPGSPGSNYSYTSPAIPPGSYLVRVRPVDNHGQYPAYSEASVTVSAPPSNTAPVASATVSCAQNVCSFDARASSDENAATLTYAWVFGNGRTGTGALTSLTYTGPGTFTITLTATDEYGATGTTTRTVTITEPTGNRAPTAVLTAPTCVGLVCGMSGASSTDPDVGDALTYLWSFGDGTPASTVAGPSHTFAAAGTYTVTLTVSDGWGRTSSATRTVTVQP